VLTPSKAESQGGFFETTLPYESLVRLAGRNRFVIVGVVLSSLAFGMVFIRHARPQYTSSAKLYIEQSSPQLLRETQDNKIAKNYLYTQATILKSNQVYQDVLEKARRSDSSGALKRFAAISNAFSYLDRRLSVGVGKKDDIVSVSFTSPDPDEAAEVTNAVVDSYKTYSEGRVRNTSGQLLEILNKEKERTDKELLAKLQTLTDYKKENNTILFTDKKDDAVSDRLGRLSEAVTRTQLDVLDAEAHYASVRAMAADSAQLRQYLQARRTQDAASVGGSESMVLRNKINTLQLQLEKLLRVLTPEHPSVKAMEDKIAATFEQLDAIEKEYVLAQQTIAQQQYLVARQKLEQIQIHFNQQQKAALESNEKQAEYLRLESERQQTQKMCDLLDERIRELDVTENAGAMNIHILERAGPPARPSFPDARRIMTLSGIIGLGLSVGIALLRDVLDGRFCCDRQVQSALGCPVAGVIPQMPSKGPAELATYAYPDSSAAQTFRKICTGIFFGLLREDARMLHICSGRAGDGKTTVVANLGIAMACSGQRTLIVDCHFSSPRLRDIFDLPSGCGIRELVQSQCTLAEAVQKTFIEGLEVLGGGRSAANPMHLLNNRQFHSLLRTLRTHYDRILLDSEAISSLPESLILSHLSDAVILVMHGERADQKAAMSIRREHEAVGSGLSAVIVTQVKCRQSGYQHNQTWRPGGGGIRILPSVFQSAVNPSINPHHECHRV
jgi:capsular exopolysaccharide synthesis family protein